MYGRHTLFTCMPHGNRLPCMGVVHDSCVCALSPRPSTPCEGLRATCEYPLPHVRGQKLHARATHNILGAKSHMWVPHTTREGPKATCKWPPHHTRGPKATHECPHHTWGVKCHTRVPHTTSEGQKPPHMRCQKPQTSAPHHTWGTKSHRQVSPTTCKGSKATHKYPPPHTHEGPKATHMSVHATCECPPWHARSQKPHISDPPHMRSQKPHASGPTIREGSKATSECPPTCEGPKATHECPPPHLRGKSHTQVPPTTCEGPKATCECPPPHTRGQKPHASAPTTHERPFYMQAVHDLCVHVWDSHVCTLSPPPSKKVTAFITLVFTWILFMEIYAMYFIPSSGGGYLNKIQLHLTPRKIPVCFQLAVLNARRQYGQYGQDFSNRILNEVWKIPVLW